MTTATVESTRQITFPAVRLPLFKVEIARLNKLAEKLGVEPLSFDVVETVERKQVPDWYAAQVGQPGFIGFACAPELLVSVEYLKVEIHGTSPKLPGGWTYLGAIEHAEAGNLVHGDNEALTSFRTAGPDCVHCGLKRSRKTTIILRSESNEIVQVGSSCLKDFLGYHGNPDRVVLFEEEIRGLNEDGEWAGGGHGKLDCPTEALIDYACACVRVLGWVPKSFDGLHTVTVVQAAFGVIRPGKNDQVLIDAVRSVNVTDADKAESKAVREWAKDIPADTTNNYLGNLRTVLSAEWIEVRHWGIGVSAVSARQKELGLAEKRAVEAGEKAASEYVGTVGQRETFDVTVIFKRAFENDYGTSYLVTCKDANGNRIKTFSSGKFGCDAAPGERYIIKGKVEHEEYQGVKETKLTRVNVVKDFS